MSAKRALLVIDMQNDYLRDGRKPKFSYDSDKLTVSVNEAIDSYSNQGCDVIYIAQVFPNVVTNRIFIGFSIKGTDGAKLYDKLNIASDLYFEKNLPNAYSSKDFREFMNREGYEEIIICGLDECGCVAATAIGALKSGAKVSILRNAAGCRYGAGKLTKTRDRLSKLGVQCTGTDI